VGAVRYVQQSMVIPNALALFALTSMVMKTTHGVGKK